MIAWPQEYMPLEAGHNYVWCVRAVSGYGEPLGDPDGLSDLHEFVVVSDSVHECVCGSCYMSVQVSQNGSPMPSAGRYQASPNDNLTFTLTTTVNCAQGCTPKIITGSWRMTVSRFDGSVVNSGGTGNTVNVSAPAGGSVHVEFYDYRSYCGGSAVCDCPNGVVDVDIPVSTHPDSDVVHKDTLCACGDCRTALTMTRSKGPAVGGLNGPVPIKSSIGEKLDFDLTVDGGCPAKCPEAVKSAWTLNFIPAKGAAINSAGKGLHATFTAKSSGRLTVTFSPVTVMCGPAGPCPCSPQTALVYITIDGDTAKPCSPATFSTEAGPAIKVGMRVDEPALFPYPRAVPIRAYGFDWDYAVFKCRHCADSDTSTFKKAVRDEVNSFVWKLDGPGWLNSGISVKLAKEAQSEIDSLAIAIARKQVEVDSLKRAKDAAPGELAKKQDAARRDIEYLTKKREAITTEMRTLADSVDRLTDAIKQSKSRADDLQGQLAGVLAQLSRDSTILAEIRARLEGHPTDREKIALKEVNDERGLLSAAEDAVISAGDALVAATNAAPATLQPLQDARDAATAQYLKLKEQLDASVGTSLRSEGALRKDSVVAAFIDRRHDWDAAMNAYIATLPAVQRAPLSVRRAVVDALGDSMLAAQTTAQRSALAAAFTTSLRSLMNDAGAAGGAPFGEAGSVSGFTVVQRAADACVDAATAASTRPPTDKKAAANLRAAGSIVLALQARVNAARDAALDADNAYSAALATLQASLAVLEQAKAQADAGRDEHAKTLERVSNDYDSLVYQRERDDLNRKEIRTDSAADFTAIVIADRMRARAASDDLEYQNRATTRMEAARDDANARRNDLKHDKEKTQAAIDADQPILSQSADPIVAAIQAAIDKLQNEIDAMSKALAGKKDNAQRLGTPSKTAGGPMVYYVPPPLEDIMTAKQLQTFKELKDSVGIAEAEVTEAREFRAGAQGSVVAQLEKVASQITAYRKAIDLIAVTPAKIDDLATEIAKKAVEKKVENLDEEAELKNAIAEQTKTAQNADARRKLAEDSAKLEKTKIDKSTSARDTAESTLNKKRMDYMRALHEFDLKGKEVAQQDTTIRGLSAEVTRYREETTGKAKELLRINRAIETAKYTDDLPTIDRLQTEYAKLADVVREKNLLLQVRVAVLQSANDKHIALVKSLDSLRRIADSSATALRATKIGDNVLSKKIQKLTDDNSVYARSRDLANNKKEEADRARADSAAAAKRLNDLKNEPMGNDEVKGLKDEKSKLEKELAQAKAEKARGDKEIPAAIAAVKKMESDAKNRLQEARTHLDGKKKELHDFLAGVFNTVKLQATITVVANDQVLDSYRFDDDAVALQNMIVYDGTRIPNLPTIDVADSCADITNGTDCAPIVSFDPDAPINEHPVVLDAPEPRTIALVYKNGEPLWPEWPVIENSNDVLAKDAVVLSTGGDDKDHLVMSCSGSYNKCLPSDSITDNIADVIQTMWVSGARFVGPQNFDHVLVEVPLLDPASCEGPMKYGRTLTNKGDIAADPVKQKGMQVDIKAGVLIEIPDTVTGSPQELRPLAPRIVTGDHKGLPGEKVEYRVRLTKGDAKNFGFVEGTTIDRNNIHPSTPHTVTTSADGYANTLFYFGEGFAEFEITVTWKRGGVCPPEKKFVATSPATIRIHHFAGAASDSSWSAALAMYNGAALAAAASIIDTANMRGVVDGVAGVMDYDRAGVNDIDVLFSMKEGASGVRVSPANAKTRAFGVARSDIKGVTKESNGVTLAATPANKKQREMFSPAEATRSYQVGSIKKFKIGPVAGAFVVELAEAATCGEPISGKGKLVLDGVDVAVGELGRAIIDELAPDLDIQDVELECAAGSEMGTATAGSIAWNGEKSYELRGFTFALTSLGVTANSDGLIKATIKTDSIEPIEFEASVNVSGNFIARLSNLPEIAARGFKLKKGASFILDMDAENNPEGTNVAPDFMGLIIPAAELQLPEAFNMSKGVPTVIGVKDFAIDPTVTGKVSVSGSVRMGYGGFAFTAKKIDFELDHNALKGSFAIDGTFEFPKPVEGTVDAKIRAVTTTGEWDCTLSTKAPVTLPNYGIVFFLTQSRFGRDKAGLYSLSLSGSIASKDKFGQINIQGLVLTSAGTASLKSASMAKRLDVGKGFSFVINDLSFDYDPPAEKYEFAMTGGFAFPSIGIKDIQGAVKVEPGSVLEISITQGEIDFKVTPVAFHGSFAYEANSFRGDFNIGISGLAKSGGGIHGVLIVGTQEVDQDHSFSYWWTELDLRVPTGIPIGQSGLMLIGMGGGVGSNYIPPIGNQAGSPRDVGGTLSLKASLTIGNVSPKGTAGDLFAGTVALALAPGAGEYNLYGKVWLLGREDAMFGEGQLNLHVGDPSSLDGRVRMFIGLPDAEARIARFNGEIAFDFHGLSSWRVYSTEIAGHVMKKLRFNGAFNVDPRHVFIEGTLKFDFPTEKEPEDADDESVIGKVLTVEAHLTAGARVEYNSPFSGTQSGDTPTIQASAQFAGLWNVGVNIPLAGSITLTSGDVRLQGLMQAKALMGVDGRIASLHMKFQATADITATIYVPFEEKTLSFKNVNLGYETTIK